MLMYNSRTRRPYRAKLKTSLSKLKIVWLGRLKINFIIFNNQGLPPKKLEPNKIKEKATVGITG